MTAKEFVKRNGITATSEWTPRNPNMDDEKGYMNNYKTTLHIRDEDGKRQFTLYYSKGKALEGEPTAEEVIDCLQSDMNCIEYGLDDFVDNFGYEYRKGKKIFDTIETQTQKLYKFLGHNRFQEFKDLEDEE